MNLNKKIMDTLSPLSVPVRFQKYTGSAETYITFFEYLAQGGLFADNKEKSTNHFIQVDIWSTTDYSTIRNSVYSAMIVAGFTRTYETDLIDTRADCTTIYHKVLRFNYSEEVI